MSKSIPTYRKHKQSGQAVVTLPDGLGGRRDVLLGKHGAAASRADYARVIAEWEANGRTLPAATKDRSVSVNELLEAFMNHAEQHYRRPDGSPAHELSDYKLTIRPLKHFYGLTPASDFGPLALKAIRQKMIDGWEHSKRGPQKPLARGVINHRIARIRRVFRWGVENEMVQPSVLQGLEAVRGLQRGRSAARETEPVKPVPEAFVEAALPFMRGPVAAMVRLQLLTGMRPGEVVIMRGIDLETSGKVWLYRPGCDLGPHGTHKSAWRGHHRVIAIGPRGQEILKTFLRTDLQAHLFSPADSVAELRAEQRANRKTRVQPSQANRKKRSPKRRAGTCYTVQSYGRAIRRACVEADAHAHHKNPMVEDVMVPPWHPNQLRHLRATMLRREFGLDTARIILGHTSPAMTAHYAEADVNKAVEIMAKLG